MSSRVVGASFPVVGHFLLNRPNINAIEAIVRREKFINYAVARTAPTLRFMTRIERLIFVVEVHLSAALQVTIFSPLQMLAESWPRAEDFDPLERD
jgi:hypothetical protein